MQSPWSRARRAGSGGRRCDATNFLDIPMTSHTDGPDHIAYRRNSDGRAWWEVYWGRFALQLNPSSATHSDRMSKSYSGLRDSPTGCADRMKLRKCIWGLITE